MCTKTILIVDDEETIRDSLQYVLSEEGYTCLAVSSGLEAEQIMQKQKTDLIILDYQSPKFSRIQMIERLRNLNPDVLILVITSYSDSEMAYKSLYAGADNILLKPVDFDELTTLLKVMFDKAAIN